MLTTPKLIIHTAPNNHSCSGTTDTKVSNFSATVSFLFIGERRTEFLLQCEAHGTTVSGDTAVQRLFDKKRQVKKQLGNEERRDTRTCSPFGDRRLNGKVDVAVPRGFRMGLVGRHDAVEAAKTADPRWNSRSNGKAGSKIVFFSSHWP